MKTRDLLGEFMDSAVAYCEATDTGKEQSIRTSLWTKMIRAYHDWKLSQAGLEPDHSEAT